MNVMMYASQRATKALVNPDVAVHRDLIEGTWAVDDKAEEVCIDLWRNVITASECSKKIELPTHQSIGLSYGSPYHDQIGNLTDKKQLKIEIVYTQSPNGGEKVLQLKMTGPRKSDGEMLDMSNYTRTDHVRLIKSSVQDIEEAIVNIYTTFGDYNERTRNCQVFAKEVVQHFKDKITSIVPLVHACGSKIGLEVSKIKELIQGVLPPLVLEDLNSKGGSQKGFDDIVSHDPDLKDDDNFKAVINILTNVEIFLDTMVKRRQRPSASSLGSSFRDPNRSRSRTPPRKQYAQYLQLIRQYKEMLKNNKSQRLS